MVRASPVRTGSTGSTVSDPDRTVADVSSWLHVTAAAFVSNPADGRVFVVVLEEPCDYGDEGIASAEGSLYEVCGSRVLEACDCYDFNAKALLDLSSVVTTVGPLEKKQKPLRALLSRHTPSSIAWGMARAASSATSSEKGSSVEREASSGMAGAFVSELRCRKRKYQDMMGALYPFVSDMLLSDPKIRNFINHVQIESKHRVFENVMRVTTSMHKKNSSFEDKIASIEAKISSLETRLYNLCAPLAPLCTESGDDVDASNAEMLMSLISSEGDDMGL